MKKGASAPFFDKLLNEIYCVTLPNRTVTPSQSAVK